MPSFQDLSTKSKIAIVSVTAIGVFGAGVVASPALEGKIQPSITPIITKETPVDPSATPTRCSVFNQLRGGGVECTNTKFITPNPTPLNP